MLRSIIFFGLLLSIIHSNIIIPQILHIICENVIHLRFDKFLKFFSGKIT